MSILCYFGPLSLSCIEYQDFHNIDPRFTLQVMSVLYTWLLNVIFIILVAINIIVVLMAINILIILVVINIGTGGNKFHHYTRGKNYYCGTDGNEYHHYIEYCCGTGGKKYHQYIGGNKYHHYTSGKNYHQFIGGQ